MIDLKGIADNVIEGDVANTSELVKAALAQGIKPKTILHDGLLAGMAVVGQRFKAGEMFIPEVIMSAEAITVGTGILEPGHFRPDLTYTGDRIL